MRHSASEKFEIIELVRARLKKVGLHFRPLPEEGALGWVHFVECTGRETAGGRGLVTERAVRAAPPGGELEKTFERVRPKAELIKGG